MENIKCLKPPTRIYQVDELANELHNCLSSIFFKRHLLPSLIHFSSIPILQHILYVSVYIYYLYIYIYMYEGPLGHIMHMLAARDFIDIKDLQE